MRRIAGALVAAVLVAVPHAPRSTEPGPALASGDVRARFSSEGARLSLPGATLTLGADAVGREGRLVPLALAVVRADDEVRLERGGGVTEWWRPDPRGLEHGLTLAGRPEGEGPLLVRLALSGVAPRERDGGIDLVGASGEVAGRYAGLVVLDAEGRSLAARLVASVASIVIRVDDTSARYPLTIDPIVATQSAVVVASDAATTDRFGNAVLTPDATRMFVGVPGDDPSMPGWTAPGSIRVFTRAGASWTEEAAIRLPSELYGALGSSLGIADDASRLVTNAASSPAIFLRTGTSWALEARLPAPPAPGGVASRFGELVMMSADGSRVLTTDEIDSTNGARAGAAHVFVRTGTSWALEASLYAPDGAAEDRFGEEAAMSADGSRIVVAAPFHWIGSTRDAGSVYVYERTGTRWRLTAVLTDGAPSTSASFGRGLALSRDGTTLLVRRFGSAQMVYPYAFAGGAWTPGTPLSAVPPGWMALSADPMRLAIGASSTTVAGRFNAGAVYLYSRVGTGFVAGPMITAPDSQSGDYFGGSVSFDAGGTTLAVGVSYDDLAVGGADAGSVRVFSVSLAPDGDACSEATACASGFCVDGVCCGTACGGGSATDCQACSAALTGGASGTCAPLSTSVAPTVTCRAAVGACDAAETCVSGTTSCPADGVSPRGTTCRAVAGVCDRAEACDGTSSACPPDGFSPSSVECRPSRSVCDLPELCTGSSRACPADRVGAAGVVCRAATGPCDGEERCDGASPVCPGDRRQPVGTLCRAPAGPCDAPEQCDGTSSSCPADRVLDVGEVCLAAMLGNPCDLADVCDGTSVVCQPRYAPPTTACGDPPSGVCDAPDHCAGTSADCMPMFTHGVECRPSAGPCDRAEQCSGASADCPVDLYQPASVSCRTSTDPACDPEETCDGLGASCPADENRCAGGTDAGLRDAGTSDAGAPADATSGGMDAALAPAPASGCGCAVGSPASAPWALLVLPCALVLRRRRAQHVRLTAQPQRPGDQRQHGKLVSHE